MVALIGNTEGVVQVSYFKKGQFSQPEAVDLMKRNWPGPVEIKSLGVVPSRGAGPRLSWWVGPAGDSSALSAFLTKGEIFS